MTASAAANRKLFAAAKKGDAAGVRAALATGADVAARDGNGWIALHEACRGAKLDAVEALLAAGADANCAHADLEYTPLFVATWTLGSAAVVRALLAGGAAPSRATKNGFTALHNAAEAGDLEALEALLAAGGDGGATPVIDRAKPDCADAVRALLAKYANVPKQRAEVVAAVAPEAPFIEAKPVAIAKIVVGGLRTRVAYTALDELRAASGGVLPAGYEDFLRGCGPGTLAGAVRVYGARTIARDREAWRARLAQHWFWGESPLLAKADAQQAVRIADTLDGDELVFHPRAPDTLLILPREAERVVLASREGLLPALTKLVERMLGRAPRKLVLEPLDDQ